VRVVEEERGVVRALSEDEGVLPRTGRVGGGGGPIVIVVVKQPAAEGANVLGLANVLSLRHVIGVALQAEDFQWSRAGRVFFSSQSQQFDLRCVGNEGGDVGRDGLNDARGLLMVEPDGETGHCYGGENNQQDEEFATVHGRGASGEWLVASVVHWPRAGRSVYFDS